MAESSEYTLMWTYTYGTGSDMTGDNVPSIELPRKEGQCNEGPVCSPILPKVQEEAEDKVQRWLQCSHSPEDSPETEKDTLALRRARMNSTLLDSSHAQNAEDAMKFMQGISTIHEDEDILFNSISETMNIYPQELQKILEKTPISNKSKPVSSTPVKIGFRKRSEIRIHPKKPLMSEMEIHEGLKTSNLRSEKPSLDHLCVTEQGMEKETASSELVPAITGPEAASTIEMSPPWVSFTTRKKIVKTSTPARQGLVGDSWNTFGIDLSSVNPENETGVELVVQESRFVNSEEIVADSGYLYYSQNASPEAMKIADGKSNTSTAVSGKRSRTLESKITNEQTEHVATEARILKRKHTQCHSVKDRVRRKATLYPPEPAQEQKGRNKVKRVQPKPKGQLETRSEIKTKAQPKVKTQHKSKPQPKSRVPPKHKGGRKPVISGRCEKGVFSLSVRIGTEANVVKMSLASSVDRTGAASSVDRMSMASSVDRMSMASSVERTAMASSVDRTAIASNVDRLSVASGINKTTITSNNERMAMASNVNTIAMASSVNRTTMSSNVNRMAMASNVDRTAMSSNVERTAMASNIDRMPMSSNGDRMLMSSNVARTAMSSNVDRTEMASDVNRMPITSKVDRTSMSSNVDRMAITSNVDRTSMASNVDKMPKSSNVDRTSMASSVDRMASSLNRLELRPRYTQLALEEVHESADDISAGHAHAQEDSAREQRGSAHVQEGKSCAQGGSNPGDTPTAKQKSSIKRSPASVDVQAVQTPQQVSNLGLPQDLVREPGAGSQRMVCTRTTATTPEPAPAKIGGWRRTVTFSEDTLLGSREWPEPLPVCAICLLDEDKVPLVSSKYAKVIDYEGLIKGVPIDCLTLFD